MGYALKDLVNLDKIRDLLTIFYKLTGIPPSMTDVNGEVLFGIGWQPVCTRFHRKNPDTFKRCVESDTKLAAQLDEATGHACYQCLNGLVDMAVPIIVDGVHLANLFTGQFFFEPPDLDRFRSQAREFGFDEAAYLDAVRQVPIFAREKMHMGMDFLKGMAEQIGAMGLERMRLAVVNEELELQIKVQTSQLRHEIRERKCAEVERIEASRLEGVLEMAGAAAHKFSQPLQTLRSDAQFIASGLNTTDTDMLEAMAMVMQSTEQLADLVSKVERITRYKSTTYRDTDRIVDLDTDMCTD